MAQKPTRSPADSLGRELATPVRVQTLPTRCEAQVKHGARAWPIECRGPVTRLNASVGGCGWCGQRYEEE